MTLVDKLMQTLVIFLTALAGATSYPIRSRSSPQVNCACNDSFTYTSGEAGISKTHPKIEIDAAAREFVAKTARDLHLDLVISEEGYDNWHGPSDPILYAGKLPYTVSGWDPACGLKSIFKSDMRWFRDGYKSKACNTFPRERAMAFVLQTFAPHWPHAHIHESSPNQIGLSRAVRKRAKGGYTASQYYPSLSCGEKIPEFSAVSLDLENQHCIEDNTFDLVLTQDVFEHIYDAAAAFKEIARTLRPGGMHIFTTPLGSKRSPSFTMAEYKKEDRKIHLHFPPQIHGNPVANGSIVTTMWGYDIADYIRQHTGMTTKIVHVTSRTMGLEHTDLIEVMVSVKTGNNSVLHKKVKGVSAPNISDVCESIFITCTEQPYLNKQRKKPSRRNRKIKIHA